VSFVTEQNGHWTLLASTLAPPVVAGAAAGVAAVTQGTQHRMLAMPEQHQLRVVSLGENGDRHFVAVLQRPINDAMGSFRMLSAKLIALGLFSLCCRSPQHRHSGWDNTAARRAAAVGATDPPWRLLRADRDSSRR